MSPSPSLRMLVDGDLPKPGDTEALVVLFDCRHCMAFRDEATNLLSPAERQRSLRFRQPQHRDEYVIAHALWRIVLAEMLDTSPTHVPLASTSHGQPCLPGTGYATSLSHSGGQVAIAVARTACIGVDIERSPPRAGMQDLLKVVCTPEESHALQCLPPSVRDDAMLALWTRKEAVLKAFGVGLLVAPSSIAADAGVSISPPPLAADAIACIVRELMLPTGWVGALAAPEVITGLRLHWLSTQWRHASEDRPAM
ncbi:4'-phosphopantetheinyl transferase family protein [Dyella jiangningensis]|nr:4'-phosphopantetheinyl transferase superfamily protein [Dyella jiangningensis]